MDLSNISTTWRPPPRASPPSRAPLGPSLLLSSSPLALAPRCSCFTRSSSIAPRSCGRAHPPSPRLLACTQRPQRPARKTCVLLLLTPPRNVALLTPPHSVAIMSPGSGDHAVRGVWSLAFGVNWFSSWDRHVSISLGHRVARDRRQMADLGRKTGIRPPKLIRDQRVIHHLAVGDVG
eukprot:3761896-Rhodomonas_salina.1